MMTHSPTSFATSSERGTLAVLLGVLALLAAILLVVGLPPAVQTSLMGERSLIEVLSAAGYAVCLVLMAALWAPRAMLQRWYMVVLLAAFGARELDLDKTPFTVGLLKARQYTGDMVQLPELAVSLLILAGLVTTGLFLIKREARSFIRGFADSNPATLAVFFGGVFIILFKTIDGLDRKLEPFGIALGEVAGHTLSIIEETGELGIPVMFGLAIFLTARRHSGGATDLSPRPVRPTI